MASMRTARFLTFLLTFLLVPISGAAQVASGPSLQGNWVRATSNYNPNDAMRIALQGQQAVLTAVPSTVVTGFAVGQVLWKQIQTNGSLQVLGNDGRYYTATVRFLSADEIEVHIGQSAQGDDQKWQRAGPSIDGDWERIGPGTPNDGMQVRVAGGQATIRYLPASAPRRLRVGSRFWQ
ncbi:MAG: hypothetical protein ACC682_15905, partial [Gemmatimonadota bacterium]